MARKTTKRLAVVLALVAAIFASSAVAAFADTPQTQLGQTQPGQTQPDPGTQPQPDPHTDPGQQPQPSEQPAPNDQRKTCHCASVTASLAAPTVSGSVSDDPHYWWMIKLSYSLKCDEGEVSACAGEVQVGPADPASAVIRQQGGETGTFTVGCSAADCAKGASGTRDFYLGLLPQDYQGKTVSVKIPVSVRCAGGQWSTTTYTFVFDGEKFNAGVSDMNGDGKPDGPPANVEPDPKPQPQPERRKCHCVKMNAAVKAITNINVWANDHRTWFFKTLWSMECEKGQIPDCKGQVMMGKPNIGSIPTAGKIVNCVAKQCGPVSGSFDFQLRIAYGDYQRKNITVTFPVYFRCAGAEGWSKKFFSVVIDKGRLNLKASDLNGDGKPDGKK